MRFSSTEILNSEKAESDSSLENCDTVSAKMGSLTSGFEPLLDELVEKMEKETEPSVCVDKTAEHLEVSMCKLEKTTIMDDNKLLVSQETIIALCSEREIDTVKEEKDFVNVISNELDPSLKEVIKSSSVASTDTCHPKVLVPTFQRGRKRKYLGSSEFKGDVRVKNEKVEKCRVELTGRVLRSRPMARCGSVNLDESVLNESLVGFKRKMEAECLNQTELKEINEKSQLTGQPQKKQKRRGRPPKAQGVTESTHLDLNDDVAHPEKVERRGRPPKVKGRGKKGQNGNSSILLTNTKKSNLVGDKKAENQAKGEKFDNLEKQDGGQSGDLLKPFTNAKKSNLLVDKNLDNQSTGKDIKKGKKIPKVEKQDEGQIGDFSKPLTIAKKSNLLEDEKDDTESKGKDVKKGDNKVHNIERREIQQLVRDKIVNMVLKAGWKIEYRPRNGREYCDAVYVDLTGGTHWSVTKAYLSLKKRIENGKAQTQEVSVFTPIPDEEISVLFRVVSKVRSDKQIPRKKKRKGSINKAELVITEGSEAPVKKKPKKKAKDDKKKKEVKLGNKTLKRQPEVGQKSQQSRKPRLVARKSKGNDEDDEGCLIYNGKRNLLAWMIDSGVIMPGGKVQYKEGITKTKKGLLEGKVTHDGIHCSCCNETMNTSRFVSHGGREVKVNQETLENMWYESSSFLTCLQESWRKEVESNGIRFNLVDVGGDDPNDDTCNICGDGGDLICCDGCPSTFHESCLDIEKFPSGVWQCVYCCCKFCGEVSHMDDSEMITCGLCEEKFHGLCIQEDDAPNLDSSGPSFCGRKCQEIFEKVKTYVGVKFELEDGFSWTLLQRADVSDDSILPEKIVCNSKLAVAFSVMDECFVPIMDERSGVNIIHDVVYNCGSNFRRLNFSGFYTVILERGDDLIAAASIRIHGNRLAEMPFIGTRHTYRRQGMCRRLLDAIESALSSLGVEELVIPAIPELYKTWTTVFGFKPLKKSKRQTMKSMSMIVFPGLNILQKPLLNNQSTQKIPSADGDDKVTNDNYTLHSEETKRSDPMDYVVKEDTPLLKDDQTSESENPPAFFEPPEAATSSVLSDTKSEHHVSSDLEVKSLSDDLASEHNKVAVVKNTFDLNLQPDSDHSNDQDSYEMSNSRVGQVDNGVLV